MAMIQAVILKAKRVDSDTRLFTPEACERIVVKLNKAAPGRFRYDKRTESVIFEGPEEELRGRTELQ